jgi:hypothetical protein
MRELERRVQALEAAAAQRVVNNAVATVLLTPHPDDPPEAHTKFLADRARAERDGAPLIVLTLSRG